MCHVICLTCMGRDLKSALWEFFGISQHLRETVACNLPLLTYNLACWLSQKDSTLTWDFALASWSHSDSALTVCIVVLHRCWLLSWTVTDDPYCKCPFSHVILDVVTMTGVLGYNAAHICWLVNNWPRFVCHLPSQVNSTTYSLIDLFLICVMLLSGF